MSSVIKFYEHWRPRPHVRQPEPAEVIVLPVVVSFEAAERLAQRRRKLRKDSQRHRIGVNA